MKKYSVILNVNLEIVVKAKDKDQAKDKVWDLYANGKLPKEIVDESQEVKWVTKIPEKAKSVFDYKYCNKIDLGD